MAMTALPIRPRSRALSVGTSRFRTKAAIKNPKPLAWPDWEDARNVRSPPLDSNGGSDSETFRCSDHGPRELLEGQSTTEEDPDLTCVKHASIASEATVLLTPAAPLPRRMHSARRNAKRRSSTQEYPLEDAWNAAKSKKSSRMPVAATTADRAVTRKSAVDTNQSPPEAGRAGKGYFEIVPNIEISQRKNSSGSHSYASSEHKLDARYSAYYQSSHAAALSQSPVAQLHSTEPSPSTTPTRFLQHSATPPLPPIPSPPGSAKISLKRRPSHGSFPRPRRRKQHTMAPSQTASYPSGANAAALNPAATYQWIQDMTAKRISTLDYLRKTHEGRVYWFNTLHFTQSDILRLPSFQTPRLARRASSLLLLGLSIPQTLDSNAHTALEYIRALNALMAEFETYQSIHPPEGGTNSLNSGSFGRSKLPKMFSRGHSTSSKNRRASTATDIGLPLPPGFESIDGIAGSEASSTTALVSTNPSASASSATLAGAAGNNHAGGAPAPTHTMALPAPDASILLPGEEYSYLLTPSIPFEPDFFEVFATLSEVLIDVYMRIAALVSSPEKVALQPGLAETFNKADARVRKVLVLGIVKEFEESTRTGVKGEIAGVGRVVLGGLV